MLQPTPRHPEASQTVKLAEMCRSLPEGHWSHQPALRAQPRVQPPAHTRDEWCLVLSPLRPVMVSSRVGAVSCLPPSP